MSTDQKRNDTRMRIAKYLAACGLASRRKCEHFITNGDVSVNGERISSCAVKVSPSTDIVNVNGTRLTLNTPKYIMLYKPVGYTCSASDKHAEKLVYSLLPESFGRLFSIGRLDRDSEGLLLFTNDGDIAQILAHPSGEVPKKYIVDTGGKVKERILQNMCKGINEQKEFLKTHVAENSIFENKPCLQLILKQGKKREIRRMCAFFHLPVNRLLRTEFGPLKLDNMKPGQWRELTNAEIKKLKQSGQHKGKKKGRKIL